MKLTDQISSAIGATVFRRAASAQRLRAERATPIEVVRDEDSNLGDAREETGSLPGTGIGSPELWGRGERTRTLTRP